MNYTKIHDAIIERARSRIYDSNLHHNHHIIPRHEDSTSTEMVPLAIKEHKLIHLLRYKMGFPLGNLMAYYLLSGMKEIDVQQKIASLAGKIGGSLTKINKSGIFSDNWDRSAETARRHKEGIIVPYLKGNSKLASIVGNASVSSKKGIHADDYDHSTASKKLWESGKMDHVRSMLRDNYRPTFEESSKGGKISGKWPWWNNGIVNTKSEQCPGDGWVRGRIKTKGKV